MVGLIVGLFCTLELVLLFLPFGWVGIIAMFLIVVRLWVWTRQFEATNQPSMCLAYGLYKLVRRRLHR